MYKRAQSTHKLPVHSAKGFANFSASLAMLPPTCLKVRWQTAFYGLVKLTEVKEKKSRRGRQEKSRRGKQEVENHNDITMRY